MLDRSSKSPSASSSFLFKHHHKLVSVIKSFLQLSDTAIFSCYSLPSPQKRELTVIYNYSYSSGRWLSPLALLESAQCQEAGACSWGFLRDPWWRVGFSPTTGKFRLNAEHPVCAQSSPAQQASKVDLQQVLEQCAPLQAGKWHRLAPPAPTLPNPLLDSFHWVLSQNWRYYQSFSPSYHQRLWPEPSCLLKKHLFGETPREQLRINQSAFSCQQEFGPSGEQGSLCQSSLSLPFTPLFPSR